MDGFSKFLKTLLLIPVIGWIVLLICATFTAPLFVAWGTVALYKEKLSQGWKNGTYTVAFLGEILLIAAIITVSKPLILAAVSVFALMLFNCAIASICARKKHDNTGK